MNNPRIWELLKSSSQLCRETGPFSKYLKFLIIPSTIPACRNCVHTSVQSYKPLKATSSAVHEEEGIFKKLMKRIRWLTVTKSKLKMSGYILYENVADKIDHAHFIKEFQMPDTLNSWFLVTEMHVWMLLVRSMAADKEGRFLRNIIVEAMWSDVSLRAKKLGPANPSIIKDQLSDMSEQFQAALIAYDEGLLLDDKVLAGAIWRHFFARSCNNPEEVECLVKYIRKQVKLLDQTSDTELMSNPNIQWLPPPLVSDVR